MIHEKKNWGPWLSKIVKSRYNFETGGDARNFCDKQDIDAMFIGTLLHDLARQFRSEF